MAKKRFLREGWHSFKRLRKVKWRRPRGIHSKMRLKKRGKPKMPSIGMKKTESLRFRHPSGLKEKLVFNLKDLEDLKEGIAIRISSKVGKRKREEILKKAKQLNLKVLNP